jgi:hypothetical protein
MKHSRTRPLRHPDLSRLRAWARVELNMNAAEFNLLQPADWARLYRMWTYKQLREDTRVARICYHIVGAFCGYKNIKNGLRGLIPSIPQELLPRKKKRFQQVDSRVTLRQFMLVLKALPVNLKPVAFTRGR